MFHGAKSFDNPTFFYNFRKVLRATSLMGTIFNMGTILPHFQRMSSYYFENASEEDTFVLVPLSVFFPKLNKKEKTTPYYLSKVKSRAIIFLREAKLLETRTIWGRVQEKGASYKMSSLYFILLDLLSNVDSSHFLNIANLSEDTLNAIKDINLEMSKEEIGKIMYKALSPYLYKSKITDYYASLK